MTGKSHRPAERVRALDLRGRLRKYDRDVARLPGIREDDEIGCLVAQLIDSLRRVEFVHAIRDGRHDPRRKHPGSGLFDPLRAAVLQYREGKSDEAFWLVFLATHFGKHGEDGWRLTEAVYGSLGQGSIWDWRRTSRALPDFRDWVAKNGDTLRGGDGISRRFSNHRKYESLKATSKKGLPAVVESYVAWVTRSGTHQGLVRELHKQVGQNPREMFAAMYRSMDDVMRFGRLGKFDYLAMLGKLGIAPIEPNSAYLREATGPLSGARLLFVGDAEDASMDTRLDSKLEGLDDHLGIGMQPLEDALCNWQKSPRAYEYFRG
jgi:Alpha-glutamyl/putrescinyl thymine pyrophosphorylase clade 3